MKFDINSMNKIVKEIVEIVGAFILAFLIYQGLGLAFGTSVPIVSIASDSMVPRLHRGDLAVAMKPENLKVGDIIIYSADCPYLPKEDIIHRIIEIKNDTFITKGDHNLVPDPCPVRKDQVKAKVVFAVPLLGWPRLILNYIVGI